MRKEVFILWDEKNETKIETTRGYKWLACADERETVRPLNRALSLWLLLEKKKCAKVIHTRRRFRAYLMSFLLTHLETKDKRELKASMSARRHSCPASVWIPFLSLHLNENRVFSPVNRIQSTSFWPSPSREMMTNDPETRLETYRWKCTFTLDAECK